MVSFATAVDKEIIDAGGFYCHTCLVGKPSTEQSPDQKQCQGCYDFWQVENNEVKSCPKDCWTNYDTIYVHYNQKYAVSKSLGVVCLGPVDGGETPQTPPKNAPVLLESVPKVEHEKSHEVEIIHEQTARLLGRPCLDLPMDKVSELVGQGFGVRALARELKLSRGTAERAINKLQQLELPIES